MNLLFVCSENRIARAGISLAVDIVDKVADDALLGLTVMHAVENFIPLTGDINQGLGKVRISGEILLG